MPSEGNLPLTKTRSGRLLKHEPLKHTHTISRGGRSHIKSCVTSQLFSTPDRSRLSLPDL